MARKKKNDSYSKGRRWGFAVMRAASQTSKGSVMACDKAMKTCRRYSDTGKKPGVVTLSKAERDAYRGIADGMYEYVQKSR